MSECVRACGCVSWHQVRGQFDFKLISGPIKSKSGCVLQPPWRGSLCVLLSVSVPFCVWPAGTTQSSALSPPSRPNPGLISVIKKTAEWRASAQQLWPCVCNCTVCACFRLRASLEAEPACSQTPRQAVMIKVWCISPQCAEQLLNQNIDCVGVALTQDAGCLVFYKGERGRRFTSQIKCWCSRCQIPPPLCRDFSAIFIG